MTARAPRVLVLGAVLGQPMGGVRRHNAELLPRAAERLASAGGALAILAGDTPPAFDCEAPLESITSDVPAGPPWRRARAEGRALRAALDAAGRAGRPFDVVHTAHLPIPNRRALRGLPLTVTLHDLRQLDPQLVGSWRSLAGRWAYRAVARRADRALFVSEHVRALFERRFPTVRGRTAVVPNAGDHLRVAQRGHAPRSYLEPGYLLHVGHLEPRKNLGVALEALALDRDLPPLVLVGSAVGGTREALDRRARALGVTERVFFLGAVDDSELPLLYAGAGCLVLPSRLEGFGIPVLEARQAGLPVAVSSAGALPEVAGADAPSFDPADPAQMVGAVRAALGSTVAVTEGPRWDDSAALLVDAWRRVAAD